MNSGWLVFSKTSQPLGTDSFCLVLTYPLSDLVLPRLTAVATCSASGMTGYPFPPLILTTPQLGHIPSVTAPPCCTTAPPCCTTAPQWSHTKILPDFSITGNIALTSFLFRIGRKNQLSIYHKPKQK